MIQETHTRSTIGSRPFYERMHPYQMITYLAIGSSAIVFVVLLLLLLPGAGRALSEISDFFIYSTVAMLLTSRFAWRAAGLYAKEQVKAIRNSLLIVLAGGSFFVLFQYYGWMEMQEVYLTLAANRGRGAAFLLLSGLHGMHVALMLIFSLLFVIFYSRVCLNPVLEITRGINNPYEHMKLKLLALGWIYLEVLWLTMLLVVTFIV